MDIENMSAAECVATWEATLDAAATKVREGLEMMLTVAPYSEAEAAVIRRWIGKHARALVAATFREVNDALAEVNGEKKSDAS